jgi:hypothetical protein
MAEQKAIKTFNVEFEPTEPDIELMTIISKAIESYKGQMSDQEYNAAMRWMFEKYLPKGNYRIAINEAQ